MVAAVARRGLLNHQEPLLARGYRGAPYICIDEACGGSQLVYNNMWLKKLVRVINLSMISPPLPVPRNSKGAVHKLRHAEGEGGGGGGYQQCDDVYIKAYVSTVWDNV